MIAVGLMSGTSLDGIDAALVDVRPSGNGYAVSLLGFQTFAFEAALHRALIAAVPPGDASAPVIAALHRALGEAFGRAARAIAGAEAPAFVASHGQTIWHDGARGVTLQIGDAFAIREAALTTVCFDFRSGDCAAGGHGAPLVAHVDAMLLGSEEEDRVAVNVGGIANVTLLPKTGGVLAAFDTGPGNMLLDAFVRGRSGGARTMDRDGVAAAAGTVDADLLAAMLSDEYFSREAPKTTGRERFGAQFLARHDERLAKLRLEDGLATLTELTAASIAAAAIPGPFAPARVVVSGGGARNRHLLERLSARLPHACVEPSDAMGIPADAKEAIAFTVLGYETLRGRSANVPAATGAARPVVLGAIAPFGLPALLAAVERECR